MGERAATDATDVAPLLWRALELVAGASIVVDETLRVVGATAEARRLLGAPVRPGEHAVRALGGGADPAIADAFLAARPASTTIRAGPAARECDVRVRTAPLRASGRPTGWLVRLAALPAPAAGADLDPFVTRDAATARVLLDAVRLAGCEACALVTGEMGVGKTTLVRAIHARSARRTQPLRTVTASLATPAYLEAQLLGATRDEAAATMLLEDAEELPHPAQGWLLAVLESRRLAPADGAAPRPYDLRLFATTHRPRELEASAGRVRPDLLLRLATVTLALPPLRARRCDVALLVERFASARHDARPEVTYRVASDALARLEAHDWPGNARELEAVLEGAFALAEGPSLSLADIERALPGGGTPVVTPREPPHDGGDEASRLRRVLERAGGDRARAAALLGVSRTTLWRRMRASGLAR
jgi:DNA-binding NtrC family response regulator